MPSFYAEGRVAFWQICGAGAIVVYIYSIGMFISLLTTSTDQILEENNSDLLWTTVQSSGPQSSTRPLNGNPTRPSNMHAPIKDNVAGKVSKLNRERAGNQIQKTHLGSMILLKVRGEIRNITKHSSGPLPPTANKITAMMTKLNRDRADNQAKKSHLGSIISFKVRSGIGNLTKHVQRNDSMVNVSIGDSVKVVNPHPFKYIINCPEMCKGIDDLFILAYIHTAPGHYKRRMVIRQTWGNSVHYSVKVRVVFVMGKTGNIETSTIQQALYFEAEQYGDIVQEDFEDTYHNLTYKGIAALKWISNSCRQARFILKADDDAFINTFTLIKHLQTSYPNGASRLLKCLVWMKSPVWRKLKWKVSFNEFKESYYPKYCAGVAYVLSTDLAIALHEISYRVPFFWVDDVYITGILPRKLGNVRHSQFMSTYLLHGNELEDKFTGPQWYTYIFSHVHNLTRIQSTWKKLVALAEGKISPTIQYALPGELKDKVYLYKHLTQAEAAAAFESRQRRRKKRSAKQLCSTVGHP